MACSKGWKPKYWNLPPPPLGAIRTADVGKKLSTEGDKLKIDGRIRLVQWSETMEHELTGKVHSIESAGQVGGRVTLGKAGDKKFWNPAWPVTAERAASSSRPVVSCVLHALNILPAWC